MSLQGFAQVSRRPMFRVGLCLGVCLCIFVDYSLKALPANPTAHFSYNTFAINSVREDCCLPTN